MKTKLFLGTAILLTSIGSFAQTNYAATSPTPGINGTNNVFLGVEAGDNNNTEGQSNVFVGYRSGTSNTGGTGSGVDVLQGKHNVFLGNLSGEANTIGHSNLYAGSNAGKSNQTGAYNVFLGNQAGINSTTDYNVFIGASAGQANTTATGNSYLGHLTGKSATGFSNTYLGARAGENSIGSRNVCLGYWSGRGDGTSGLGDLNVVIGHQAGRYETGNHKLYIANSSTTSPLVYGVFESTTTNSELKFNAQRVGIGFEGTTDPGFGDFPANTLVNYDDYRLFVRGGILAEEVRIRTQATWADYVFTDDYYLMPLNEVEEYIADNGHLPNMPSAKQVEEEGLELGNIVKLQQEKIEELTLHLIAQEKEMEAMKAQLQELLNRE
ncbi:hypothetical protein [Flavobacterium litorale]|uniref:Peptidase S74 domain-containing protein n=1 Tax=Flavobacterium litorale TaxID=2856519 RepID=A0ABX8V9S8_9FLAO|nr:hypothetical protein [Flavobacterium litorale]QYJ67419.1 hypothetical protein K1I41_07575 [Flavobacterium litorale]